MASSGRTPAEYCAAFEPGYIRKKKSLRGRFGVLAFFIDLEGMDDLLFHCYLEQVVSTSNFPGFLTFPWLKGRPLVTIMGTRCHHDQGTDDDSAAGGQF